MTVFSWFIFKAWGKSFISDHLLYYQAKSKNRKTHTRTLTPRAYKYITHLTLSYNIHASSAKHHELLFNKTDDKEALIAAMSAVIALTTNLTYFGINFWSPSLKSLFPNFSFDARPEWMLTSDSETRALRSSRPILPINVIPAIPAASSKTTPKRPRSTATFPISATESSQLKTPIQFNSSWLLPAVNALIQKGGIKTFALLRDGKGCGVLDWNREKNNITKGVSRDLMRGIAKVLN